MVYTSRRTRRGLLPARVYPKTQPSLKRGLHLGSPPTTVQVAIEGDSCYDAACCKSCQQRPGGDRSTERSERCPQQAGRLMVAKIVFRVSRAFLYSIPIESPNGTVFELEEWIVSANPDRFARHALPRFKASRCFHLPAFQSAATLGSCRMKPR